MEISLYRKVSSSEMNEFITSSLNTYWANNELVLQPKSGSVTFDFKGTPAQSCAIKFRRVSGNGILLLCSDKNKAYQVNSKNNQVISYDFGSDKQLKIHRTQRSRGDLSIIDISLYMNAYTRDDWNNEVCKAEGHACLRIIGNQLHASEGAWIKASEIDVQTNPANMFIKNKDTVRFLGSCRIVKLNISKGDLKKPEPPVKSLNLPIKREEKINKKPQPEISNVALTKSAPKENLVVYDTKTAGFSQAFCNAFAKATASGVTINHRGAYNIPLKNINSNTTYIVKVQIAKTSGNGKFMFGILPDQVTTSARIATTMAKDFVSEIRPSQGGNSYTLSVWRHPSAKGYVQLYRLIVTSNEETQPLEVREVSHISLSSEPPRIPTVTALNMPILSSVNKPLFVRDSLNAVAKTAMQYAKPPPSNYEAVPFSFNTTIRTNTYDGLLWLSRISPFIPKVKVGENPHASISTINDLIGAKKMYIDEFSDKIADSAMEALRGADKIFVSSNLNAEAIRHKIGDVDIHVLPKALPYTNHRKLGFLNFKYIVISNENASVTEHILKSLGGLGFKIVVLNARGRYPDMVFPVNEYVSHDILVSIFSKALFYIDVPFVEDRVSSYVDLAMSLGVQVISSSWAYMEFPHVLFVNGVSDVGGRQVPDGKELKSIILESPEIPREVSTNKLNEKFNTFAKYLFL